MTPEMARTVYLLALGTGVVAWVAALLFHRRTWPSRLPRPAEPAATEEVTVAAEPAVVRRRLLATLRGGLAGLGPVSLGESAEDRVAGELWFAARSRKPLRFEIVLAPGAGGGTVATCRLWDLPGGWMRLVSAAFVYGLSPVALLAIGIVIPRLVLGSEQAGIRAQAVQTFQIVHFLWPPFLFCGLTRYLRRLSVGAFRTLLRNMAAA